MIVRAQLKYTYMCFILISVHLNIYSEDKYIDVCVFEKTELK